MKKLLTAAILASMLALPLGTPARANHPHQKFVKGPHCGGRFTDSDDCSFRFKGGQLYVGGSVRGFGLPSGAATIRLEAVSRITGKRRVLLSCTTPASGGCAAGGSYETLEHVRKGQKLFCIVDGLGRGEYECGTMIKKRRQ
jgi:hypothetical protein